MADKNDYSLASPLEQRRYKRYKNLSAVFEKISEKRTILDIGTGPGTGLRAFKDSNWDVTEYEPDPARAEIAIQQHGIRMLKKLEESSETYDFVTIIQVLEHIHQPYDFLNNIIPLVKTGGYIYIEVPDLVNFVNWRDALYLEHMNNFTVNTLTLLCSRFNLALRYRLFPKTTPYGATHIGALFEKVEHNPDMDTSLDDISKDICNSYVKGLPISSPVFPIKYRISEINNIAITTNDNYPVVDKKNRFINMRQSKNIIEKLKFINLKLKSTDNSINFVRKRLALHFHYISLDILKDPDFEDLKFIKINKKDYTNERV
ncbi:class I SAM-dependent methyltransferase [Dissulfurispira sp.]|uniref:class I SAM-dependent methyltransferase n=1 Tax=Dissulfurispira sp. TaxID=2817609 RepID=UPI002FD9F97E